MRRWQSVCARMLHTGPEQWQYVLLPILETQAGDWNSRLCQLETVDVIHKKSIKDLTQWSREFSRRRHSFRVTPGLKTLVGLSGR